MRLFFDAGKREKLWGKAKKYTTRSSGWMTVFEYVRLLMAEAQGIRAENVSVW